MPPAGRRRRAVASVLLALSLNLGAWSVTPLTVAAAGPEPFVSRTGTELRLGGRPWSLYGASTYGTSNPGAPTSIATEIGLATKAGLNTLRLVNMFDERGLSGTAPEDESNWVRMDQLLAAMHVAGLHAILDLSAFRNHLHNRELYLKGSASIDAGEPIPAECGGRSGDDLARCVGARWCVDNQASCTGPYSIDRSAEWDAFLSFVAERTNTINGLRYRDDPTIALVAFAGEPNPPNSGEPLKPTSGELTSFYQRVFGSWKSHDANHLVTTGGLLHIDWEEVYQNPSGSGIDIAAIASIPNGDVLSIHDYFTRLPATAATDTKAAKIATAAASVNKPWIIEEFGFPQAPIDGSTSPATAFTEEHRGVWFRNVIETARQPRAGAPAAGVAFWNLGPEVSGSSHDVNPATPATWQAVLDYAHRPATTLLSIGPSGGNGDTSVGFFVGASSDGSHVLFQTREALVPEDTDASIDVYERADGATRLISVGTASDFFLSQGDWRYSDDGSVLAFQTDIALRPEDTDVQLDVYRWSNGALELWSTGPNDTGSAFGQLGGLTADGQTLVFDSNGTLVPEDVDTEIDVYARSNGVTTLLSPSSGLGSDKRATYSGMSTDAVHVFFSTEESLIPADTDGIFDVYERTAGQTLLVSTSATDPGLAGGGFAGATADGRHAYFVSDSSFSPLDTDLNPDIYERFGGATRLVTTNAARANGTNLAAFRGVSADGVHVFAETDAPFAAADNDTRVDVYDFTAGDAVLVSTGGLPVAGGDAIDAAYLAASQDGSRVFFSSKEHLVDTDTDSAGTDVFERSGGATTLVSGVGGPGYGIDAIFNAASADGSRAFFTTSEPIAPADTNGVNDIYEWDGGAPILIRTVGPQQGIEFVAATPSGDRLIVKSMGNLAPNDTDDVRNDVYAIDLPVPDRYDYVMATGHGLQLHGQPFTFTGINIYDANSDGWCNYTMDGGILETSLDQIGLGPTRQGVIRAWFFQPLAASKAPLAGKFSGARDWTRFDRTINEARARGYRVIVTLANQWGECGHGGATAPYKLPAWYQGGYRSLQPEDVAAYVSYASYRDFVAEVVGRYRDDPTVLAWQLINEGETNPNWPRPNSCPPGDATRDAIKGWATDVATLIKAIDPNHLVSLGTIGSGQCGASGPQYKSLHDIAAIDLCEFHDYDSPVPMPGDSDNGLAKRIQECGQLGKPLFIGETGLRSTDVGGSYDSRVAAFRAKLLAQRAAGVVGHLVWNWVPSGSLLNNYAIGPGDPVLMLLRSGPAFADPPTTLENDYVAPTIALGSPNRGLYTLNEPVTASYTCTEYPFSIAPTGVMSCSGPVADGAQLETSTVGHYSFTVTTTDGNGNTRSRSKEYDVTAGDVTSTVEGSGGVATVSTDPGGVGASAAVPIQTSVAFSLPAGTSATVAINLEPPTVPPPSGYTILGNQVSIDLGGLTRPVNDPIVITFVVDSSTGADPDTIAISRTDGGPPTVAEPCGAGGVSDHDPCFIADWVAGAGGDVRVTVYTTHASIWLALESTDTTPPTIAPTVTGTLGTNDWYVSDVGLTWAVTDPQSGISLSTGCGPSSITSDTASVTKTCTASSAGGTASGSVTIKRDATPPGLVCGTATFVIGATGAVVSATVSDVLSGPLAAGVSGPANTATAGKRIVALTGRDLAGNSTTVSCQYVVGYRVVVQKPPPNLVVKRGSTVSVKVALQDAANRLISDSQGRALAAACGMRIAFSGGDPSPSCAAYDAAHDQFTFDLKTSKTLTPGIYTITIRVFAGADVVNVATVPVDVRS